MAPNEQDKWPWETYLAAWRTFRLISDENQAIAQHLVTRPGWPRKDNLVICDLGCGDGHVINTLVVGENSTSIAEVRLVDPDRDLLGEAVKCVGATTLVPRVIRHLGTARQLFPACAVGADVVLAVHVVYLMEKEEFDQILHRSPVGIPLYVVLDSPSSVFTALWEHTGSMYHARSLGAHRIVRSLDPCDFQVRTSTLSSQITNPYHLKPEQRRDLILSFLCYRELSTAEPDLLERVFQIIARHTDGGFVRCESTCYEITRSGS